MEFIPFERVSISEARARLDTELHAPPMIDWKALRLIVDQEKIACGTETWANDLPMQLYPATLITRFPHIANTLARLWERPLHCERYFDSLVLDDRGVRKGFPYDAAQEVSALKAYYVGNFVDRHFGTWGDRIEW